MGNKPGLIEDVCVARNEKVGVYGFVFYRGEAIRLDRFDEILTSCRWRLAAMYCGR